MILEIQYLFGFPKNDFLDDCFLAMMVFLILVVIDRLSCVKRLGGFITHVDWFLGLSISGDLTFQFKLNSIL
ncbi:hypothetical protein ACHAXS_009851 [Conticribra weissflogii]